MTNLVRIGLLAATLASAPCAQALVLSGSFSGIADASPLLFEDPFLPVSYYDGALVTGTFQLDLTWFIPSSTPAYEAFGQMTVNYHVKDLYFEFSTNDVTGYLTYPSLQPGEQSVSFETDRFLQYGGASLTFTGPIGSLFNGEESASVHYDPASPPTIFSQFGDQHYDIRVNTVATQVSFEPGPEVPEPGTAPLFLAGMAALWWRFAGRRREPSTTGCR